jgi:hypothetical protein
VSKEKQDYGMAMCPMKNCSYVVPVLKNARGWYYVNCPYHGVQQSGKEGFQTTMKLIMEGKEPPKVGPGRPEPGRPEPGRPKPGRAESGRPEPGRPEPGRQEPGREEPGQAGVDDLDEWMEA